MGRPGLTVGALHQLGIAMVCRDQHRAAAATDGIQQAADALINGGDGFGGCIHHAGVSDHVGIGVVDHDQAVGALLDGRDAAVRELLGGHGG